ncbi:MAG: monovalent cation:proton antiporter-2 (CPA2) family protein [Gammaproteobacteria bacterium]|nr:monovalent cation:proton antiporter-2 (CPA2) family protein [Gammaproteobacteria bacterium]
MELLPQVIVYLVAAIIAVPLSKRLGFGSVLGYLAAGIIIGPSALRLVKDPEHILHFAELGVVFLLFIIGLELQPSRLWVLRRMVFGLGAAQVLLTGIVIGVVAWLAGVQPVTAGVTGIILALSSTAFVLQMLAEKKQLTTSYGRAAFSILLFQDLAVIPLIALLPLIGETSSAETPNLMLMIGAVGGLAVGGRYLLRPALRIVARTGIPELFTATALLVVIGSAMLMQLAGMSLVLGAFIAGMLLADSEYRHELEADIAPFKGLLLGLFFIAVGMSVDLQLLAERPATILSVVAVLMLCKGLVLFLLAKAFGLSGIAAPVSLAAVLAQGGEFAFVLFALATDAGIVDDELAGLLVLAVVVSMLLTPIVYLLNEAVSKRLNPPGDPEYDAMDEHDHDVIIAGFGRVGQIAGRLLRIVNKPFTALEIDSSQVDVVRRYGNKVYYGDASKLELLRAAGAHKAKIFILAIDDMEASVRTAEAVARHFPNLKIIARARNRRHQHRLMDIGVEHIFRETLLSSLAISERLLSDLGFRDEQVGKIVSAFRESDEKLIVQQHAVHDDEEKLIQTARDTAQELESLLRNDETFRA